MSITVRNCKDEGGKPFHVHAMPEQMVSVLLAGNIAKVQYNARPNYKGGTTRKIDANHYCDTRSGEVKEFRHNQSRISDPKSVRKTMMRGSNIIRANCTKPSSWRFLTLTYAQNMTDHKKLYNDFKNFLKRLPSEYKPHKWISAVEPQKRGAWHLHVIFVYESEAPYLDNQRIATAWKQGFVTIQAVDNVDDLGAYLVAYLTDVEITEATPTLDNTKIKTLTDEYGLAKRYKKGARLFMYPRGMHIFRHSSNCTIPQVEYMTSSTARSMVQNMTMTYESTKIIEDTESGYSTIINTQYYNSVRRSK